MLQVFFTIELTLSAVVTTKDFDNLEHGLSYAVDFMTRNPTATCNVLTKSRYEDNLTTTRCTHTLFTNAFTLVNLRTCP